MNILLTHSYTQKNKGDAAILAAMLLELKKVLPNSHITVLSMDPHSADGGIELLPSFFYIAIYAKINFISRIAQAIYVTVSTLIWSVVYRLSGLQLNLILTKSIKKTLLAYTQADIVVPIGGGYLLGRPGLLSTISLLLHLHAIYIAYLLDKPTVLFSQSIGPFGNWLQRTMTKFVLNKVNTIFVRETISTQTLEHIGVDKPDVVLAADAAFLYERSGTSFAEVEFKTIGIDSTQPIIGITVRQWLKHDEQEKYRKAIAEMVDYLAGRDMQVVFIPQVVASLQNDDDREEARRIKQYIKTKKMIWYLEKEYTLDEINDIYQHLTFLIGTRMHSVIFALSSKVPAIALGYEYKTSGIMKDLGLESWVIPMNETTFDRLQSLFHELVDGRKNYLEKLHNTLPEYISKARAPLEKIIGLAKQ